MTMEIYKTNKNKIKSILSKNSKFNSDNRPVVEKNDEWIKEKEWDYLFEDLKRERGYK